MTKAISYIHPWEFKATSNQAVVVGSNSPAACLYRLIRMESRACLRNYLTVINAPDARRSDLHS